MSMWEQSTEPTIVGGPVGHPDGSFNQIWGGNSNVASKSSGSDVWGGVNLTPNQPWGGNNVDQQSGSNKPPGGGGGNSSGWGDQTIPPTVNGWQNGPTNVRTPTTSGGWGGTAGPSPPSGNWNNANPTTQQQWTGTSPNSGGSSWSQVASKNVPPSMAPQPASVRPKNAPGYDQGTSGWGAQPVDQGTPWQEPQMGAQMKNDWSNNGAGSWDRGPSHAHKSDGGNWNNGGGGMPGHKDKGADPYWKNDRHASSSQWNAGGNGGGGGGHWDGGVQSSGRSHSYNSDHQTPSNVWTGPPAPQEADSSMVWNNPYPKKIAQPDKGTNVWGDPNIQTAVEIKRWKSSSDDSNALSSSSATSTAGGTGSATGQTLTPSSSSVWNDSPMAPQPPQQKSTSATGWTTSSPTNVMSQQSSSLTSPTNWDTAANGANTKTGGPTASAGNWGSVSANDNGWNGPPSKVNEINRQSSGNVSGDLDADNSTDDVFTSNPTSPLTPGVGGVPLNKMNGTSNGLPGNYPLVAQPLQIPVVKPMQSNQQLQMLTKQISVQLRAAVQAGLIDINILYQPLPPDSLLRLNELLGCVPQLDQAQKELQHLQDIQRRGQPLNPTQSQEVKRLTEDIRRYSIRIQQIKQQIVNSTSAVAQGRPLSNNSNNAADCLSSKSNGDALSQSKLMQWKNGATNDVNDKKLSVSSSAPNLENLEQNLSSLGLGAAAAASVASQSDLWSSNKRHSGLDWPTSDSKSGNPSNDSNSFDGVESGMNTLDSESSGNSNVSIINQSSGMSPSSNSTEENRQDFPQEFKPGQPWAWRDPSKVAEDPNATPGSVKPSALTKINVDSAFSNSPFMHNIAYGGVGGGMQSSFFGATTPTKMNNYVDKPANVSPSLSADSYMAQQRHSRPPSQMGQPFINRPPLMKQPFSAPTNAFVPFNNSLVQWVVLTNLTQIDERTLSAIINQYGTTTSVVSPPGSGFAFVKFREAPLERLLPRMQSDLAQFGITVQIMKENEVERLLQALSTRTPQPFNPPNSAPHAPPHPAAAAGGIWDAPPPPIGAWGGHPPFGAAGLSMPDAMAQQMMPMPDMFGMPGGNDRHAF